jgi:uncharacterized membrane protein YgcG
MDRLATFVVEDVIPAFNSFVEKYGPAITKTFRDLSEFIATNVVPILRDHLIPFIQRVAEFIGERLVPVIRDIAVKTLDGLRKVFEAVSQKIRDNQDNIDKLVGFLRDFGGFVQQYVAPVLITVLGKAFDFVAKAIGPVIDVIFDLIGVFATLGSFVIKIASSVLGAIEGMVNGFIKIINGVISVANKIPGIDIGEVGEVNIPRPSLGVAPPAPVRTPTVPSGVTDSFQRTIAPLGSPSFTPGVDEGLDEEDEEDGRGGGRGGGRRRGAGGGGGGGGGVGGAVDMSFSGSLLNNAFLQGNSAYEPDQGGTPSGFGVVNVTVNTVSADSNLPNLIVDALQRYNLVNGPIDISVID